MMKLAISGKGGVGKTTLTSLLAGAYAADGTTVLALEADLDAKLVGALGVPPEEIHGIGPISEMNDRI